MRDFFAIRRVAVPRQIIADTQTALRVAGRAGDEAFALWVGRIDGEIFRVTQTVIPRQAALRSDLGVCVTVSAEELHRLNIWLHKMELRLIAQVHSHPDAAYHSETDDRYPIATTNGALSLVVPEFAAQDLSIDQCAVFRLHGFEDWRELSSAETERLISVEA